LRRLIRVVVIGGMGLTAAAGGSLYAFANWTLAPAPALLTMRTATMPPGNTPSIEQRGRNAVLHWVPNRVAAGVAAQSYVVLRHGVDGSTEVCRSTVPRCTERDVPIGTWKWTVRPVYETWEGADSVPTSSLTYHARPASESIPDPAARPADPPETTTRSESVAPSTLPSTPTPVPKVTTADPPQVETPLDPPPSEVESESPAPQTSTDGS
jgi:hypothetical protein